MKKLLSLILSLVLLLPTISLAQSNNPYILVTVSSSDEFVAPFHLLEMSDGRTATPLLFHAQILNERIRFVKVNKDDSNYKLGIPDGGEKYLSVSFKDVKCNIWGDKTPFVTIEELPALAVDVFALRDCLELAEGSTDENPNPLIPVARFERVIETFGFDPYPSLDGRTMIPILEIIDYFIEQGIWYK